MKLNFLPNPSRSMNTNDLQININSYSYAQTQYKSQQYYNMDIESWYQLMNDSGPMKVPRYNRVCFQELSHQMWQILKSKAFTNMIVYSRKLSADMAKMFPNLVYEYLTYHNSVPFQLQMRDSLRQAYNSFYSQRESKSVSPSTGRIHNQRQSFGPTVCLISKSTQSDQPNTNVDDKIQIFMLILEIERLNKIIVALNQSSMVAKLATEESQIQFLRKQLSNLKIQLQKSHNQKYSEVERQNRIIYSQTNKINECQVQITTCNRRLREFQQTNQGLREKIRDLQGQVQRAKAQVSRVNMNYMMSSQSQLQKSTMREKSAMEMQLWKQKLAKYQIMINEQKQFINEQKRIIDKLNNTELQLKQRYEYEISMFKKSNDQLTEKCHKLERETSNKILNSSAEASRELNGKQRQIDMLKEQIKQAKRQNEELRRNLQLTSKSKNENIEQMRNVINQLRQSLEEVSNELNIKASQLEKKDQVNNNLKMENQKLRIQLQQIGKQYDKQALSAREHEIRKIEKSRRKLQAEGRIQKSFSTSNLKTSTSSGYSSPDLRGIIQDVMELQQANSRVNRLIQTKSRSQVYQQKISYSNYGM